MTDSAQLTKAFETAFDSLDEPGTAGTATSRSRGRGGLVFRVAERDGVLMVDDGTRTRGSGVRSRDSGVQWVKQLAKLEGNEITGYLAKLDRKLTPERGLRRFVDGQWESLLTFPRDGRVLLIVHGTFSNSENVWNGVLKNPNGERFLAWAADQYDSIVGFDHATVGLSPMLNANDLARAVGGTEADIDVVTHSRGGLVTRWWLEAFDGADPTTRRVVFVGSPLAGTGLAAPPRIRATLGMLTNLSSALGTATSMIPLTTAIGGIFKVVASITSLTAKTPAVDAAVAMIPGLAAQSRVGNNHELNEQRQFIGPWQDRYFAVQSNFESDNPGWRFWRHFRASAIADHGADIVFDGQNDLVVDTGSMREFTDTVGLPDDQVLDYGTNNTVHHINYFEQEPTLEFIREKLTI